MQKPVVYVLRLNLFLILWIQHTLAYEVPTAQIKVFYPKGFEVSIPHEEGITLFAFHGKLNEEMDGLEAGTWARDIVKPKEGRWIFRERNTKLKLGDTLYYWTYVIYNGLGYREEDGVYVVQHYDNTTTANRFGSTDQCVSSVTTVNGVPVRCKGQIIFEDEFKGTALDNKKWSVERRIPQQPDYEFNLYLDDKPEVLQVREGAVNIKPVASSKYYFGEVLKKPFSLGPTCTGKLATDECEFEFKGLNRLNPLITAQFKTKNKFSFKYGKVEIKAKMPAAMWVYPQLWLEPAKLLYGESEYQSGQMRVAQTIANDHEVELMAGLILNSMQPWRSNTQCVHKNKNLQFTQDFHAYELNWTPTFISFAVDGEEYCRWQVNDESEALRNIKISEQYLPNRDLLLTGSKWAPFDQEFYLTLGYGVGGNNDFEDVKKWQQEKPWLNTDPRSKQHFWKEYANHAQWLDNSDFKIDYVKVYAV